VALYTEIRLRSLIIASRTLHESAFPNRKLVADRENAEYDWEVKSNAPKGTLMKLALRGRDSSCFPE